MSGKDLGQKTFVENVYDDVVKTFCIIAYIKLFDEYFVNIVDSPSLTNPARTIVIDSHHYD